VNGAAGAVSGNPLVSVKRGTPVVIKIVNQTPDDPADPPARPRLPPAAPVRRRLGALLARHPAGAGGPHRADRLPRRQSGKWLLASTVLERFDTGLWTWFEVT
jgi:hypothetical protein